MGMLAEEQDLYRRLSDLAASDEEGLRLFGEEIASWCRAPARTILEEWTQGPPERAVPCAFACMQLRELAVAEMLRQAGSVPAALRVQFMETVIDQFLSFRELLLSVLGPLLPKQRPGWQAATGEMRPCDAAYLLVRKIVRVEDGEAVEFSTEEQFLALDADRRLGEIGRWRRSKSWRAVYPET